MIETLESFTSIFRHSGVNIAQLIVLFKIEAIVMSSFCICGAAKVSSYFIKKMLNIHFRLALYAKILYAKIEFCGILSSTLPSVGAHPHSLREFLRFLHASTATYLRPGMPF